MNHETFFPLLLCFASGITVSILVGCCVYLFRRHNNYQFQRVCAILIIMLAVAFFNNFIALAFNNFSDQEYFDMLTNLYDYIVVGAFVVFEVSIVYPNRFSYLQLSLFDAPYVVAFLLYAITHNMLIYPIVLLYTIVSCTIICICQIIHIRKYNQYLQDNLGNLEHYDLSWNVRLIGLLYVVQLIWAIGGLWSMEWVTTENSGPSLLPGIIWCFATDIYIPIVVRKITNQETIVVPLEETTQPNDSETEYYKVLNNSDIDGVIKKNNYHLDADLTLQKLALLLGTNRQYLSAYINREKQKTFYEYINDFRLEEAKCLIDKGDEKSRPSLEEIATLSGFNSYSTFLRQFVRRYGESPSQYMKNKK